MSQQSDRRTLQDRHLDMMIQLAFMKEEEEEIQKILDTPDPTLSPEEEEEAKRIFQVAIDKSEKKERRKKIIQFSSAAKKVVPKFVQVAASIILIAGIATPIALANSAYFRSRVMQLLAEIDNENQEAHFSFEEDAESSFSVPEVWTGMYYPSYIPSDFEVIDYVDLFHSIELAADDNKTILFSELDEETTEMRGTENAVISTTVIRGAEATIIDGYHNNIHNVTIVWALDNNWFDLVTYGIETGEAIRIAESVRMIKK